MALTVAQFRKAALALPGAVEGAHMDHPDFRVGGRIFATIAPDGCRGMVKLTPAQQRALLAAHDGVFTPASGAWGKQGCTMVVLALAGRAVAEAALADAWQNAMALPQKQRRAAARRRR